MKEHFGKVYLKSPAEAIEKAGSNKDGLSSGEAERRREEYGPNDLPEVKPEPLWLIFIKQFHNALTYILIVAAIISAVAGMMIDTWVIVAAILVNVIIGFAQVYRAQKAILSLKVMIELNVKVLRDGREVTVPAVELVPGDVIILEEGDGVPADGRIIQSKNLRTVEASLTGESLPVSKEKEKLDSEVPLADRKNMVWRGTFVAGGYARVLVTGTGRNTALGDISETLGDIEERSTSFSRRTGTLAKQMSVIAIASAVIIFLTGFFIREFSFNEVLMTSIAALVAAIPEGLTVIFSIVLAIGAKRMARRNAIVREFAATETLGAVTTILTDKTGTLTQNSLTVRRIWLPDEDEIEVSGEGWFPAGNFVRHDSIIDEPRQLENLHKLLEIAAVSNNSSITHEQESDTYELMGDPTEGALLVVAKKGGIHPEEFKDLKLDDLPFNSEMKLRATLKKGDNQNQLYVVGAPEEILSKSSSLRYAHGDSVMESTHRKQIQRKVEEWSGQALRVIALAYKRYSEDEIEEEALKDLVFAGMVGMIDPPRKEVKESVEKCKRAGIRVIMLTGDHANTAVAIARATGIVADVGSEETRALTEHQLEDLDPDEFDHAINNVSVFARLSPKMKLRIANRLQEMGHLVAMTGDGVNDAPALKKADVGVAMGISGTDVARESADMVLADDNFATIVNAIEEGRIVFTNVRQTSFFLITTNLAESMTLLIGIASGLPLPLTATQILWLNLVTDGVTDLALATEPGHGDIMNRKPLSTDEKIMNKSVIPYLLINVSLMAGLSLGAFLFFRDVSVDKARTAAFAIMAFTQLFNVYNMRSLHTSAFRIGLFSNKWINIAVGGSVVLLVAITEIPAIAKVFRFESLGAVEFVVMFALSSAVFFAVELYKYFRRVS